MLKSDLILQALGEDLFSVGVLHVCRRTRRAVGRAVGSKKVLPANLSSSERPVLGIPAQACSQGTGHCK